MASKFQHKCACSQPNLHIILLVLLQLSKCIVLVIFVDLAYLEHEETGMLAVFTYPNELGFKPGLTHLSTLHELSL